MHYSLNSNNDGKRLTLSAFYFDREFYDDVVPELKKCGTLIQFKVCCNLEPHLRGNVYVQYQTIREAVEVKQIK